MTTTVTFHIDEQQVTVPQGTTVLQAAKQIGIEIPHFCYHDKLSIAGNCRMCLVEVEDQRGKAPKPAASCHMQAYDGLKVYTKSEETREAQKGTMEFLLINHPLDCPICDQGGECDLQDIAVSYGSDRSRFTEMKRAVDDRDIGAKIKTVMTRCIHCTRCIRFATEIAGVEEMGATGRGEAMEVGTYVEKALESELSGNMIDICPVGALTNKPYAFQARPWELQSTDSIDVMDSLGSNIRVDHRAGEVMRIVPRDNDAVNECWISDTARFSWDGLANNRLETPRVSGKKAGWPQAFEAVKKALKSVKGDDVGVLIGGYTPAEGLYAAREFFTNNLGVPAKNINAATNWQGFKPAERCHYTLNTPLADIEAADAVLLIGCDPRHEAPLLNLRLRKAALITKAPIANVGAPLDLRFDIEELGDSPDVVAELASGKHKFAKVLSKAQRPLIIFGKAAQERKDANALLKQVAELAEKTGVITLGWNGFNILPHGAGRTAALDLFGAPQQLPTELMNKKVLIVIGNPEADLSGAKAKTILYTGTHINAISKQASIVLPTAAYTEQAGWWTNAEGRVQAATAAVSPPLQAKPDWKIWRALSGEIGNALPFNNLAQLRDQLAEAHDAYTNIGEIIGSDWVKPKATGKTLKAKFEASVSQFYLTNDILRASQVMQDCQAELDGSSQDKKAAA